MATDLAWGTAGQKSCSLSGQCCNEQGSRCGLGGGLVLRMPLAALTNPESLRELHLGEEASQGDETHSRADGVRSSPGRSCQENPRKEDAAAVSATCLP